MTGLILPKRVVAQLRAKAPTDTGAVPGFQRNGNRHALNSDDFLDPSDVADQVKQFIDYTGAVPKPVGWRLSVLVLTIPEVTAGGILMVDDNRDARSLASPQGVIVGVAPQAYADPARFQDGKPWVSIGDRVMFQKYAGRMFQLRTGQHIAILNDTDIAGIVDTGWLSASEDEA